MSDEAPQEKGPIPYERFAEVNAQLADAKKRLAEIDAAHKLEVTALEKRLTKATTDYETATKRASELEGAVEAERLGVHIARAGVSDPDLVDLVRSKYLATDAKDRPEFGAWYAEWAKEKPYLAPAQPSQPPAGKQPAPTPPNKGADRPADLVARVGGMSTADYAANRDAILKELGFKT